MRYCESVASSPSFPTKKLTELQKTIVHQTTHLLCSWKPQSTTHLGGRREGEKRIFFCFSVIFISVLISPNWGGSAPGEAGGDSRGRCQAEAGSFSVR